MDGEWMLPKGMRIVKADEKDMEYVVSCIRRSIELSVTETERELSDLWMNGILDIGLESIRTKRMDDEVFVLKKANGSNSGSLWLGKSVDQFTCDTTGYILGIFIEPDMRRKGLGSLLLHFAENWCHENGFLHLTLNVGWRNECARQFYESHGYRIRSEVRRKDLY